MPRRARHLGAARMEGAMRTVHTSRSGQGLCAIGPRAVQWRRSRLGELSAISCQRSAKALGRRPHSRHGEQVSLSPRRAGITHYSSLITHHFRRGEQASLRLAFTLIEMMVVVGILALLISIVVPVTASLLERNKATQTRATMKVLEQAITAFSNARPLANVGLVRRRPTGNPPPNDWRDESLTSVFGTLPPSPTGRFVDVTGKSWDVLVYDDFKIVQPPWASSLSYTSESTAAGRAVVLAEFDNFLLPIVKGGYWEHKRRDPSNPGAWAWLAPNASTDATSVECLVFCLNEFCPESRSILSQLPATVKTNEDKDIAYENTVNYTAHLPDAAEKIVDLVEIIDAWKRPLRYSVKEPAGWDPIASKFFYQAVWELRSAGPNGEFDEPFTSEDSSDDVVLKGP